MNKRNLFGLGFVVALAAFILLGGIRRAEQVSPPPAPVSKTPEVAPPAVPELPKRSKGISEEDAGNVAILYSAESLRGNTANDPEWRFKLMAEQFKEGGLTELGGCYHSKHDSPAQVCIYTKDVARTSTSSVILAGKNVKSEKVNVAFPVYGRHAYPELKVMIAVSDREIRLSCNNSDFINQFKTFAGPLPTSMESVNTLLVKVEEEDDVQAIMKLADFLLLTLSWLEQNL